MTPSEPASFDLRLVGIGVAGGAVSGFFGVGGGIVLVPLLLGYLGLTRRAAHATSLGAIILLSVAGMLGFALSGQVEPVAGVTIGVGGMIGGAIGAQLMNRLSTRTLRLVFALVLVGAGTRMVF